MSYLPRLNRLATPSKGNHTLPYKLQHGSFRQPPNNTATTIRKLATRPRSISYRCFSTSLEVSDGLCFPPPLQSNCSSSQQGDSGQCRSGSCRSNLVSSASHSPHLMRDPSDPSRVHPMFPRLHLTVCRISSSTIKQKAFLDRLPNCFSQQLGLPLERPTSQHGPAKVAGAPKGKLILFQPHSQKFLSF